jgi:tetratricopeptide (TPR) repeat protein
LEDRIAYVSKAAQNSSVKSASAERLGTAKAEYLSSIEKVSQHDVQLAINNGRYRTALFISRKLVEFNPRSSEDYFWLAESYRTLGPRTPELAPKELTSGAKKDAAKKRSKLTLEEEEIKLMKTATGQAFWKANQQKAESLYLQSLELDISNYRAHRGLGMLYEKNLRRQEAVNEYEKYLELAPEAPDKERISRRLENLKKP